MDFGQVKVTPKKREVLELMQIVSWQDLLSYYPYRFDDMSRTPLVEAQDEQRIVIDGMVASDPKVMFFGPNKTRMSFTMEIDSQLIQVMIYNRHFIKPYIKMQSMITIIGKYDVNKQLIVASDIKLKPLYELEPLIPIYSLKDGIKQNDLRKLIKEALFIYGDQVDDVIPVNYKEKYRLLDKKQALRCIHFPKNLIEIKHAYRYLKYEEFLKFQLIMQLLKKQNQTNVFGVSKTYNEKLVKSFINELPFKLTNDQQTALDDILADMSSNRVMYRLIQGDVGSGKTIVASIAMYANYLAEYQSALMVPTEILAKQHYQTLKKLFSHLDIRIELLVGSLKAKDKQLIQERLARNDIDMVIGTHALIQDKVRFSNLGLVITDEQHRFGVNQRKQLKEKGERVDFLLMTATPIPRTLALSIFGDMDVSSIQTMPVGRKPIITHYIKSRSIRSIIKDFKNYLATGGQAYIVCPLIEESETLDYKNVTEVYESLKVYFEKTPYQLGLIHGRLDEKDKQEMMDAFVRNEIQILVSTTVIEVGVDVKNANVMIIYDADRFGLSQLHQLRGRVGRNDDQGYCYLLSNKKDEDVVERLTFLENHTDGFEISEFDLKRRGPGEVLGQRQSGLPSFVVADIVEDFNILEIARKDALEILEHYDSNQYFEIRRFIEQAIQKNITYID